MSCYWLIRGLKTFGVRMERLNRSAQLVAEYLEGHRKVRRVCYPGLASHPHHEIAVRQMTGFGAVVTFEINCDLGRTLKSLGGPETLVTHPALNSYYNISRKRRYRLGIIDELVQVSVGLQGPRDIIADLERGFTSMGQSPVAGSRSDLLDRTFWLLT